jgi:hypothetical protein
MYLFERLLIYGSTVLLGGTWTLFTLLILYTFDRTPWTGDQPLGRPLPTHTTTQTRNKRTQISMPRKGFDTLTPVFEWANIVHALYLAATEIGG